MARVRLSVDIDAELKHKIAVLAALRGTTISELVVEAVRKTTDLEGVFPPDQSTVSLHGALSHYSSREKRKHEQDAWADHVDHAEKR
ncbi:MAG: ribbon-helix-helix protein, CopG family [Spirochaetota bacterium]